MCAILNSPQRAAPLPCARLHHPASPKSWASKWKSRVSSLKGSSGGVTLLTDQQCQRLWRDPLAPAFEEKRGSWGHQMTKTPFAVVLCKFSDQPQEPRAPQFYKDCFTETGAGTGGAFDYWRDVSFGNLDLTGSRVFGWFTMPSHKLSDLAGLGRGSFVSWGTDAAQANHVDLSPFFGIIVVFNAATDSGASGGRQMVLGYKSHDWSPTFNSHEMGHVFGLDHSFGTEPIPCASGDGRPGAYCDKWDIMSAANVFTFNNAFGGNGPGLNAPYLDKLGCVPINRIWTPPSADFRGTVRLAALNHPEAPGPLMIKIPRLSGSNPSVSTSYTAEFRRKTGWDAGIPNDAVLIHEVRSDGLSYLQRMATGPEFIPGSEFTDATRTVSLQPVKFDPNASTAEVIVQLTSVAKPRSCEDILRTLGALQDHLADLILVFESSGNPPKIGQMIQRLEGVLARLRTEATSAGCLR